MARRAFLVLGLLSLLGLAGPVHAVVITDCCDWSSGWAFSSYGIGAGTATATVEATGGNPGPRLNVTTVTNSPADSAFGTAVLTANTTVAPTAGAAFTLTLDVLSGAGGFGQGQGIQLLVQQAGSVYAMSLGITGFPLNTFTTLNFSGNFNAGSFTRISGAGPATPSFDGTTSTAYGFAAGNNNSATLTQYYDNFRLSIPSIGGPAFGGAHETIPTLSQWTLLLLVIAVGLLATVRLRRRR